jgi:hypothetical protein
VKNYDYKYRSPKLNGDKSDSIVCFVHVCLLISQSRLKAGIHGWLNFRRHSNANNGELNTAYTASLVPIVKFSSKIRKEITQAKRK